MSKVDRARRRIKQLQARDRGGGVKRGEGVNKGKGERIARGKPMFSRDISFCKASG